jgi:hypothetical protein
MNFLIYFICGALSIVPRQLRQVGPAVRNAFTWLKINDFLELQKNSTKVVDFGFQNVKWYHLVHLSTKVVVLCYSLSNHQYPKSCFISVCPIVTLHIEISPFMPVFYLLWCSEHPIEHALLVCYCLCVSFHFIIQWARPIFLKKQMSGCLARENN